MASRGRYVSFGDRAHVNRSSLETRQAGAWTVGDLKETGHMR